MGNTALKFAVFSQREMLKSGGFDYSGVEDLADQIKEFTLSACILSAVTNIPPRLPGFLREKCKLLVLDAETPLPIVNNYGSPATLGHDRLANACGAAALFPQSDALVIDAGTCLKFDFIRGGAVYEGGAISPGLHMRYHALHQGTAQLPLLQPRAMNPLLGKDTPGSMHSGVVNGMLAEINGIVQQYSESSPRLQVLLTGGDMNFFLNQLKSRIFAAPHLTLQGLNGILLHQAHD